ncbi:MAG TPA: dihydrofolate reductase family protein [Archangium sp.]
MSTPFCSVFIATSVDGFIARRDGGIDWLSRVERPGEDYGFAAFFETVDALVMGRNTWEIVKAFPTWPYGDKRVIVLTHRPLSPVKNEETFSGEPRALVEKLGAEGVRRVYVDGGVVIQSFLRAGLVDELTVSQIPVLLGEGIPLFAGAGRETALQLVESRAFDSGLIRSTWLRPKEA